MTARQQDIAEDQVTANAEEEKMKPEDRSAETLLNGGTGPSDSQNNDEVGPNPKGGATSDSNAASEATSSTKAKSDLSAVDPFDPNRFRRKTLAAAVGAQAGLAKCSLVKKPNADQFVRASTDPELSDLPCTLLELETTKEVYILPPNVADEVASRLPTLVKYVSLTLGIDRQGDPFLWRTVPEDAPNGENPWHVSGRLALAAAQKKWVRVESNQGQGYYEHHSVNIDIPDPVWPGHSMRDYLKIVFAGRIIDEVSHPVIQRLLGNVA